MAQHHLITGADRALAQLLEAQRATARAEAWRRFQADERTTLYEATREVVAELLARHADLDAPQRQAA